MTAHISGTQATAALAWYAALGVTYDPDITTATSDGDGPGEPVIAQRDLDERAELAYERSLDERWAG